MVASKDRRPTRSQGRRPAAATRPITWAGGYVDRLTEVVSSARTASATQIHAEIRGALKEFVGDEPTHDDSTLIVLKFS